MACIRDRCSQGHKPCPSPYECWTRAGGATVSQGEVSNQIDPPIYDDGISLAWFAVRVALLLLALGCSLMVAAGFYFNR